MPPGPAYNWLCVAHSVCDVLSHAAQIRVAQLARTGVGHTDGVLHKRKQEELYPGVTVEAVESQQVVVQAAAQEELPREVVTEPPSRSHSSQVTMGNEGRQYDAAGVRSYLRLASSELPKGLPELPKVTSAKAPRRSPVSPIGKAQNPSHSPLFAAETFPTPVPPPPLPAEAKQLDVPSVGDPSASTGIPGCAEVRTPRQTRHIHAPDTAKSVCSTCTVEHS